MPERRFLPRQSRIHGIHPSMKFKPIASSRLSHLFLPSKDHSTTLKNQWPSIIGRLCYLAGILWNSLRYSVRCRPTRSERLQYGYSAFSGCLKDQLTDVLPLRVQLSNTAQNIAHMTTIDHPYKVAP